MSNPDLIPVARQIVDYFNAGNWNELKSILTPDALYDEVGTQRQARGAEQAVKVLQEWKQGMTDARGTVTNAFGSGSSVTLEVTWQGTHNGALATPSGDLPASGKQQTTRAAVIVSFQGSKVKEVHQYFDMLSMLQQIGAIPAAARV